MNHDGDQWNGVHNWKTVENAMGQRVERSETPHGAYTISGHGAGRMKWSVNRNLNEDTNESEWEALGRTKREVRGEADSHLKGMMGDK